MWNIDIQQLANLIGGTLHLSAMPPLAGEHEAVGRIVPTDALLRNGDVVLVRSEESTCLEHWLLSGATGIIATRKCEAAAGGFCIVVEDSTDAMRTLAAFHRDAYPGKLSITITAGSEPGTDREDLYWQLIDLDFDATESQVLLSVDDFEMLPWCHPEEVVIGEHIKSARRAALMRCIPPQAALRHAA